MEHALVGPAMQPAPRIRILIVDDHPVVRHGLMAAIGRQPDLTVVGAVADLEQALCLCQTDRPDVILLDLRLPGVPPDQAVLQIRDAHPTGRILLLSTDEAGFDLCRALESSAAGCVLRTAELEEMLDAIRAIHTGASWLSAEVAESCRAYRSGVQLSDDELACLRLLASGRNSRQIADALGWSERQVRDGMGRIRQKLGAKNETHMLVTALRRGIVSLEEYQTGRR
jgi:DNA-binding NarL/FixJ family response regulator